MESYKTKEIPKMFSSSGLCAAERKRSAEAPDDREHGQDAVQNGEPRRRVQSGAGSVSGMQQRRRAGERGAGLVRLQAGEDPGGDPGNAPGSSRDHQDAPETEHLFLSAVLRCQPPGSQLSKYGVEEGAEGTRSDHGSGRAQNRDGDGEPRCEPAAPRPPGPTEPAGTGHDPLPLSSGCSLVVTAGIRPNRPACPLVLVLDWFADPGTTLPGFRPEV